MRETVTVDAGLFRLLTKLYAKGVCGNKNTDELVQQITDLQNKLDSEAIARLEALNEK